MSKTLAAIAGALLLVAVVESPAHHSVWAEFDSERDRDILTAGRINQCRR